VWYSAGWCLAPDVFESKFGGSCVKIQEIPGPDVMDLWYCYLMLAGVCWLAANYSVRRVGWCENKQSVKERRGKEIQPAS
jgi:hypothetical protein